MKKERTRFDNYNAKCRLFCIKFRKGKDDDYIKFLEDCPNKMEFVRQAIDRALSET